MAVTSSSLAAKAQEANALARELAEDTLSVMGRDTQSLGRLTTSCAPYQTARKAVVNLSNAALRLWELACVCRAEESYRVSDGESDAPVEIRGESAEAIVSEPIGSDE